MGYSTKHLFEEGSSTVEYIGLAAVVSMLTTAIATAIDSVLGNRIADTVVKVLINAFENAS